MRRSGLTLLEIVLSLALAAVAISLMAQLVRMGNQAAAYARDQTKAQMVAQSVMAEFTSGIAPPVSVQETNWLMDPDWSYSATIGMSASQTMYIITVTAKHTADADNPATFQLTQWLAIPPEPEEEEDTALEGGV